MYTSKSLSPLRTSSFCLQLLHTFVCSIPLYVTDNPTPQIVDESLHNLSKMKTYFSIFKIE